MTGLNLKIRETWCRGSVISRMQGWQKALQTALDEIKAIRGRK